MVWGSLEGWFRRVSEGFRGFRGCWAYHLGLLHFDVCFWLGPKAEHETKASRTTMSSPLQRGQIDSRAQCKRGKGTALQNKKKRNQDPDSSCMVTGSPLKTKETSNRSHFWGLPQKRHPNCHVFPSSPTGMADCKATCSRCFNPPTVRGRFPPTVEGYGVIAGRFQGGFRRVARWPGDSARSSGT